jgi:hypothetical protein
MKKFVIVLLLAFAAMVSYGQISPDSSYVGSSVLKVIGEDPNNLGGDSRKVAYTKINSLFDTLHTFFVIDTVVNAPDSAQIDAILGIPPASAIGKRWYIKDVGGKFYFVISDGTEWYVDSLTAL